MISSKRGTSRRSSCFAARIEDENPKWYVEQTMGPGRQYRLGGHSKGGNLAVYAAMTCGDILQAQ